MPTSIQGALPHCPEGRYTRLPDALLSVLTPREHQLVHALLSYRWTDDALIYPRVKTLAVRIGCSERTVQRTLRRLETKGYLIIEARYRDDQGQTSNVYRPGPLLVALLPPGDVGSVTTRRHDHHPPVTRVPAKRDSGKHYAASQRPSMPVDPTKYTVGPLGAFIRT